RSHRSFQKCSFKILQKKSFACATSHVTMTLLSRPLRYPYQSLVLVFALWKGLLLLVALLSPGIGYDTSTILLLHDLPNKARWPWLSHVLCEKLTRWDAIYFAKIGERGYLFEQEWAFSVTFTRLVGVLAQGRLQILLIVHLTDCK